MEVTAAASGLDAKALIDDANLESFCSSSTRLLSGAEELKNAFQLVVIFEVALTEPLFPPIPRRLGLAGADPAVGCTDDGAARMPRFPGPASR